MGLLFDALIVLSISLIAASLVCFLFWAIIRNFISVSIRKKTLKMYVLVFVTGYLLIGFYGYNQDLFFPEKFPKEYLEWLKQTPLEERIIDTIAWPGIFIGNFFP